MQLLKVYGDNAKLSRNTKNVLEDIELKILEQTFEVYSPSVGHLLIGRSCAIFFVNDKSDRHNMSGSIVAMPA